MSNGAVGMTDLSNAWLVESLSVYRERIALAEGALLFDEGDAGDSLYLLSSGRAVVVVP